MAKPASSCFVGCYRAANTPWLLRREAAGGVPRAPDRALRAALACAPCHCPPRSLRERGRAGGRLGRAGERLLLAVLEGPLALHARPLSRVLLPRAQAAAAHTAAALAAVSPPLAARDCPPPPAASPSHAAAAASPGPPASPAAAAALCLLSLPLLLCGCYLLLSCPHLQRLSPLVHNRCPAAVAAAAAFSSASAAPGLRGGGGGDAGVALGLPQRVLPLDRPDS